MIVQFMQAYKTPKNPFMPWLQALETDTPNCSKPKQLSPDKSGLKARTCSVKIKTALSRSDVDHVLVQSAFD